MTDGRFTTLPGGLPLAIGGQVVEAIGVGSGSGGQDIAVATAGAEALKGERGTGLLSPEKFDAFLAAS